MVTEAVVGGSAYQYDVGRAELGFTDARTYIGIRTPRYKLIRDVSGQVELYELTSTRRARQRGRRSEVPGGGPRSHPLWRKYKDSPAPSQPVDAVEPEHVPIQTTASTDKQWDGVLAATGTPSIDACRVSGFQDRLSRVCTGDERDAGPAVRTGAAEIEACDVVRLIDVTAEKVTGR